MVLQSLMAINQAFDMRVHVRNAIRRVENSIAPAQNRKGQAFFWKRPVQNSNFRVQTLRLAGLNGNSRAFDSIARPQTCDRAAQSQSTLLRFCSVLENVLKVMGRDFKHVLESSKDGDRGCITSRCTRILRADWQIWVECQKLLPLSKSAEWGRRHFQMGKAMILRLPSSASRESIGSNCCT
jgi:hypothetical protein